MVTFYISQPRSQRNIVHQCNHTSNVRLANKVSIDLKVNKTNFNRSILNEPEIVRNVIQSVTRKFLKLTFLSSQECTSLQNIGEAEKMKYIVNSKRVWDIFPRLYNSVFVPNGFSGSQVWSMNHLVHWSWEQKPCWPVAQVAPFKVTS